MPLIPHPAIGQAHRIVAVPVPRSDSSVGKCLAMLDANPDLIFTVDQLAARLRIDRALVMQSLGDLSSRGLATSEAARRTAGKGGKGATYLWRLARDYSAHVRSVLERGI